MAWKIVAIDETRYLTHPIIGVEKVWAVYFYTDQQVAHLCEIEPSYELFFVRHVVQGTLDEERLAELEDDFNQEQEPAMYMHCRDVEKLPPDQVMLVPGTTRLDPEDDYRVQRDDIFEWLRGNFVVPDCAL